MFSRATSIPAFTSSRIFSVEPTAGPRVQTILALRTSSSLANLGSIQVGDVHQRLQHPPQLSELRLAEVLAPGCLDPLDDRTPQLDGVPPPLRDHDQPGPGVVGIGHPADVPGPLQLV